MQKSFLLTALIITFSTHHIYSKIVQISMMKVGTYLGISLIQKMTQKRLSPVGPEAAEKARQGQQDVINVTPNDFRKLSNLPECIFWATHSPYVKEYAETLSRPEYQVLFIYRDPRDVVVSFALFIRDKDKNFWPGAQQLSLDETITRLITGGESMHVTSHHISKVGIKKMFDAYLPWMTLPNVLAIRFEDLIGPKGGGNLDSQVRTIIAVAKHIGKTITYDEAIIYGKSIYGNSWSFNKGQIGSWREYFTENHIQLFKKHAGQLLIDLGYEQDKEW